MRTRKELRLTMMPGQAIDLVREQKDRGQIRRFTGNDYADDLAAGNVAVACQTACEL